MLGPSHNIPLVPQQSAAGGCRCSSLSSAPQAVISAHSVADPPRVWGLLAFIPPYRQHLPSLSIAGVVSVARSPFPQAFHTPALPKDSHKQTGKHLITVCPFYETFLCLLCSCWLFKLSSKRHLQLPAAVPCFLPSPSSSGLPLLEVFCSFCLPSALRLAGFWGDVAL